MRLLPILVASLSLPLMAADEAPKEPKADKPEQSKETPPVTREGTVSIAGKEIPYTVTASKLVLKDDQGKPRASIFNVTYTRSGLSEEERRKRPVMFAFNGGPGSSAVWLHLGVLGPKIIKLPGNGTEAPLPPAVLIDNPESILDVTDLVFVDPVSTGYSRAEKDVKASEFHGVEDDIASVGDFIRRWITENGRWSSPKFLLGESYGGIRVAGLANHLQSRYGMSLNGIVMLSSLIDFRTLSNGPGDDLLYPVYLPAYAGVAHFHGKVKGNRDALVEEARQFAFGEYAAALLQGTQLPNEQRTALADKLASYSGIPAETWMNHDLRVDPEFFRAELLRKEGKVIGRFDGRVAWGATSEAAPYANYDPSYSLAQGAFSTTMLDYLSRDLGWKEDSPYEILTGKVQPWSWDKSNGYVNLSSRVAKAMRDNPHLKVHVMCGYTDLATPPDGILYSFRHLFDLPKEQRTNISFTHYDGGHMFYLNPPDLKKSRKDLLQFIEAAKHN
jgi:carboxypeptidase C (cathepsin A)